MKTLRRPGIIIAIIVGLILASALHYETETGLSKFPTFDLYKHGFVGSAIIQDGPSTHNIEGLAPTGQRLSVRVTSEDIHIPWTMYLPIYQFGTIIGTRHFDVTLSEPVIQGDFVDFRSEVSSFRLFPRLNRQSETHAELDKVLSDGIAHRVKEGNALNKRTNNGQGTASL